MARVPLGGLAALFLLCLLPVQAQTSTTGPAERLSTLSFTSATYEVDEDAGSIDVTVQRGMYTSHPASVVVHVAAGTAPQRDFVAGEATVTFETGEIEKTVLVAVYDNDMKDGDRTLVLTLSDPGPDCILGTPSTATLTIRDDETPAGQGLPAPAAWVAGGLLLAAGALRRSQH